MSIQRISALLCLGATTLFAVLPLNVQADEATITVTVTSETPSKAPFEGKRAAVDVAILLDTSNSMDGLISQAKNQLWTIVQQFAKAKKRGKTPLLRVALFEYGNTSLPAAEGYIRQVVPLTDDLDELSEALFALTTNGGDEYCGETINEALDRLDWTSEPNAYKAIFIAGNEPFTQGSVDYRESCKKAIEAGVVVNTIHCGTYEAGVSGMWQDGAELTEGRYFNIDQDRKTVHIKCPQDKLILELNTKLNSTYLWFGAAEQRVRYEARQFAQDSNAAGESEGTALARAAAKVSPAYNNSARDLVDAYAENEPMAKEISDDQLPEKMRGMSAAEREEYVGEMAGKRAEIQQQIAKLNAEREAYIRAEKEKLAEADEEDTLGTAMSAAIHDQLSAAGFDVE